MTSHQKSVVDQSSLVVGGHVVSDAAGLEPQFLQKAKTVSKTHLHTSSAKPDVGSKSPARGGDSEAVNTARGGDSGVESTARGGDSEVVSTE